MRKSPATQRPVRREPRPRVVVGLAPGVVQLDGRCRRRRGRASVAVGDVGARRDVGGQERAAAADAEAAAGAAHPAELAGVDEQVPAVGQLVAVEAGRHVLVADDPRPAVATRRRRRRRTPRCRRRGRRGRGCRRSCGRRSSSSPAAPRRPPRRWPTPLASKHDQPVAGPQRDDVGERLDHGDAVGDLGQLVGDPVQRVLAAHPESMMRLLSASRSAMPGR